MSYATAQDLYTGQKSLFGGISPISHEMASVTTRGPANDPNHSDFSGSALFMIGNGQKHGHKAYKNTSGYAGAGGAEQDDFLACNSSLHRQELIRTIFNGTGYANKLLDNLTNNKAWKGAFSNALASVGVRSVNQNKVLSSLSAMAKENSLDLSTVSANDTPEIAAKKLAVANPQMFAMNPLSGEPLRANELAEECSSPADIATMCNNQGLSQDHAILMVTGLSLEQYLDFTPHLAQKINAPIFSGLAYTH